MIGLRLLLLLLAPGLVQAMPAAGDAQLSICFNYGCVRQDEVHFRASTLRRVAAGLDLATTAAQERAQVGEAVGRLYRLAALQTPVGADRGGNYLDGGVTGRMDCIDHSTSTTRMLQLLESRGMLRFHRVLQPERRTRFIFQHFSAVLEELSLAACLERLPSAAAPGRCDGIEDERIDEGPDGAETARPGKRYVVDSWFVDNGEPAVVLPLVEWLNGGGPNVQ
jgi:hypothetical protein